MPLRWLRCWLSTSNCSQSMSISLWRWISIALFISWLGTTAAMLPGRVAQLRKETVSMFYHGFDNYMRIAFPEDELRPVSCTPLTRDRHNPRNVELNDVLGNYSLTLIDSLSTLAIIASAPLDKAGTGKKALRDFQDGVASLVQQYGDGTSGPSGQGLRARGFDVDSKVQVFETVIRGLGGLLSAHLFAIGELPIQGYKPVFARSTSQKLPKYHTPTIIWPNKFKYNGQLLRLALDLAERLLPAFYTHTGMPYPRVNLRHGIPFYVNSPLHEGSGIENTQRGAPEITETCSAGAGSLVLEFTVLSRLTGDPRFEQLAKRAFWAVWSRRSSIGLIGTGVDAENGQWIGAYSGIGAGADSFFEYAVKTYILLSGQDTPNLTTSYERIHDSWLDPNTIYSPLSVEENQPETFLNAWHEAHAAIKRHLYSNIHHPHYVNVHLATGSPQAYWIDSLGAYYPGLLTLAGEVEEAIETNLLYTALWTRYAALPERWSVREGNVEGGLGWWPGRPEFIESNYYLYRATRDPWYLHVGEMVLEDIKQRCWTKCGWSGLQDVRTGEKSDRMESFFLGETAKYLYLLFDSEHPLNKLDAAYVFTTEGHPLLIPNKIRSPLGKRKPRPTTELQPYSATQVTDTCPAPPAPLPFTVSVTAARRDIFHASSLIGLDMIPNYRSIQGDPDATVAANHTIYPWTLPESLLPVNGICDKLPLKTTFTIEFPINTPAPNAGGNGNFNVVFGPQGVVRLNEGILIKSLSGLKLGMVYESPSPFHGVNGPLSESWRVWSIAHTPLGRDEKVFISRDILGSINDPSFRRIRDPIMLDLVLQLKNAAPETNQTTSPDSEEYYEDATTETLTIEFDEESVGSADVASDYKTLLSAFFHQVTSVLRDPVATIIPEPEEPPVYQFATLQAIAPTGLGAAPIVEVDEAPNPNIGPASELLTWTKFYFADYACDERLPDEAVKSHQVIVMKRGGCTFNEKLANIPSFTPTAKGLKLVVVVSDEDDEEADVHTDGTEHENEGIGGAESKLIRPLLDKPQVTPSGLLRHHQISMVMVAGGQEVIDAMKRTRSMGLRRRYHVESQGLTVGNIIVV
ncbi:glycoside hydrolase family 47 protein [Xylogone sp. PMI_703]|nr:glycoside hydrolase family 47 protein [Xylogone sp. PMI_703]